MIVATAMPSQAMAVIESRMPTLSARCGGANTPADEFTPEACQTTGRGGTHRLSSLGLVERTAVATSARRAHDSNRSTVMGVMLLGRLAVLLSATAIAM